MSIYQLKSRFQSLLRPFVHYLYNKGVTANQVTLFAAFMTISYAATMYLIGPSLLWLFWILILFFRMALNAIDGMLAREHKQASTLGFILNELCDVLSDVAVFLSFLACTAFNEPLMIAIVLLAWLTEFVAIMATHIKGERANHGPMGKSDRAFVFVLLAIWIAFATPSDILALTIQCLIVVSLLITIYRRIKAII